MDIKKDLEEYLSRPEWYNALLREMGHTPPDIERVKELMEQLDD